MARKSAESGGRLVCSNCHCSDFRVYRTQQGVTDTFRYRQCRHCGKKVLTRQAPEQFIRDIHPEPDPPEAEDMEDYGDGSLL
jgi:hypothetical protein